MALQGTLLSASATMGTFILSRLAATTQSGERGASSVRSEPAAKVRPLASAVISAHHHLELAARRRAVPWLKHIRTHCTALLPQRELLNPEKYIVFFMPAAAWVYTGHLAAALATWCTGAAIMKGALPYRWLPKDKEGRVTQPRLDPGE